ncbi:MAG TPA: FKBP-type peptidyl-prolyl cis-trans isomerase [Phycisphaeraceae bacterium]
MPIIVLSPHSGRPVKVRDQDISRAVRDEAGRIFYVVPRSDGKGYYAALTRHGSPKDEQRYQELEAQAARQQELAAQSIESVHDATGRRRTHPLRQAVMWLLLLLILAALVYSVLRWTGYWVWPPATPAPGPAPAPQNVEPVEPAPPQPAAPAQEPAAQELSQVFPTTSPSAAAGQPADPWAGFVTTASGLRYRIDRPGQGEAAAAGQFVRVKYEAWGPKGRLLGRSAPGKPAGFVLWSGQAVRAWDEGIAGMREGEQRTLVFPLNLAQGGAVPAELIRIAAATTPATPATAGESASQDSPGASNASRGAGLIRCAVELVEVLPGVSWTVEREGRGEMAWPGDVVEVNYRGFVADATVPFVSSYEQGQPLTFRIGAGEVIAGWEVGVIGMREGEMRVLRIPPHLGYGSRGIGDLVPADATLRFEVELLKVIG